MAKRGPSASGAVTGAWGGVAARTSDVAQLGQAAGGMDYAAVGQAVSRFVRRWEKDPTLRREVTKIESQLSNVWI